MNLTPRPAFSRILPFAIYIIFLAIASGLEALQELGYLGDWDPRWLYPIKVGAVLVALVWLWRYYSELALPVAKKTMDWVIAAIIGVVVFVLWINLDQGWVTLGSDSPGFNPVSDDGEINWLLVAFRLVGATLIVPVMEELFWRSFILRWIDNINFLQVSPAKTSIKAFIITAVLFGISHNLWLAGILAGIAYGWLYMRNNNLWIPIFSHAITNALLGVWIIITGSWQLW